MILPFYLFNLRFRPRSKGLLQVFGHLREIPGPGGAEPANVGAKRYPTKIWRFNVTKKTCAASRFQTLDPRETSNSKVQGAELLALLTASIVDSSPPSHTFILLATKLQRVGLLQDGRWLYSHTWAPNYFQFVQKSPICPLECLEKDDQGIQPQTQNTEKALVTFTNQTYKRSTADNHLFQW